MDARILDLRLTASGRKALTHLQNALRLSRPGDVLRAVAARGVVPDPGLVGDRREPLSDRMRATVDGRMAADIRTLAAYGRTSFERYVDALLREALHHVDRDGTWHAKASTPTITTTGSRTACPTTRTRTGTTPSRPNRSPASSTGFA